jgi:hypothetical protein
MNLISSDSDSCPDWSHKPYLVALGIRCSHKSKDHHELGIVQTLCSIKLHSSHEGILMAESMKKCEVGCTEVAFCFLFACERWRG